MRKISYALFVLLMIVGLSGCADSRLDTTDEKAFIQSVQAIYDSVEGKDREDFAKFFFIAMNGRSDLITLSQLNSEEIPRLDSFFKVLVSRKSPEAIQALHGMSASEIVELGRTLKITYLDGRIQELKREIATFKDAHDFFASYQQETNKVSLSLPEEPEKIVSEEGMITEVHLVVKVANNSESTLVGLGHEEAHMVLLYGSEERKVELADFTIIDEQGVEVFQNGGIPKSTEYELKLIGRVSHFGWQYPPKAPIKVKYPSEMAPSLEGWEEVHSAEDSFKRVYELERNLARLSRQMDETKA
ncbi:MAG: hypothetical protein LBE27_06155 [Deltaproteobacteria bacterium]|jgi:hypothetical protein|nr:hypothetical protein [Deltaproteobacteria bacterium]